MDIAKLLNVTKSVVPKILQKYVSGGDIRNAPKSGRPRKTTVTIDKTILKVLIVNPRKSSRQIRNEISEQSSIEVISRTVRNCLIVGDFHRIVAVITRCSQRRI